MLLLMLIACCIQCAKLESQTSYESYTRYDIPLPNKVTPILNYRGSKTNTELQYAPLILKSEKAQSMDSTPTPNEGTKNHGARKIEPQISERIPFPPNIALSFIPGYNIQLLSQNNGQKKIMHNEDYYKNSEQSRRIMTNNEDLKSADSIVKNNADSLNSNNRNIFGLEKYKFNQVNTRPKTLTAMESPDIQPFLVVRTPRLHLNVARAYHFAYLPNKALNEIILRKQDKKHYQKTYLSTNQSKNCQLHRVS
ncbi:unnamed protein product [Leptosia nina]|uniref:Uncharacterized protein n=1 Tax=Leptosia nina TaxID=320188 RepID=A0AAV1K091_9NEOP